MKRLFLLFVFVSLSSTSALRAADPDIQLTDAGTVVKEGVSYNNIADALLNRQITTAEFSFALGQWQARLVAERADSRAGRTAAETKLATLVTGAKEALSKPTSAERVAAAVVLLQEVEQSAAEKELQELRAKEAEIAARKAELEAIITNPN